MASPDALAGGLDIAGHLAVLADDVPLRVEFRGDTIAVLLPDLRAALKLRDKMTKESRRAAFLNVQTQLARAGLELQVWIDDRQVASLSSTSRRRWIVARLGLDPIELRYREIIACLMRPRRSSS